VEVDWTPAAPLEAHPLAMRSAVHSETGSVMGPLRDADGSHAVLLPGQRVDITFDTYHPYRPSSSRNTAYALDVSGYLYEWPPEEATAGRACFLPASSGSDRVAVVSYLLRHREVFLPLVYERWKQRR